MKKKLVSLIVSMTLALITLTGCGKDTGNPLDSMSKEELKTYCMNLEASYNQLSTEYTQLDTIYQALSTEELPNAAISLSGDGTGRYTFNSVDSQIIFPTSFQYPAAEPVSATGSIDVVNNVSVTPGSNWILKLNGSSLELEHSSGISGTIKVGGVTETYDKSLLQSEVMEQWFINMPDNSVSYKNIFIDNTMFGVQAVTPTMIDSENAVLRCGMVSYGDYAITYIFVYRGEQDVNKDESIMNVINTINIMGNNINVES